MEAAPTGCYKCGRPGHWSRDCPFSPSNPDTSSSLKASVASGGSGSGGRGGGSSSFSAVQKPVVKPKKVPRTRPKLTPDILLSDDGLGYVLRYFPRAFKYRGRGNEEPSQSMNNVTGASTASKSGCIEETSNGVSKNGPNLSGKAEITEEQRARMEANRLKALERRAARALL